MGNIFCLPSLGRALATVAVPHRASGVLQEALRFYSGLSICIFPVVGVGSRFLLLLVVSSDGIVAVAPAPQRAQENFPCFEHQHRLLYKLVGLVVASLIRARFLL